MDGDIRLLQRHFGLFHSNHGEILGCSAGPSAEYSMQVAGMQIHLSGNVFHLNITVIVLMQEIDASFNVELALFTAFPFIIQPGDAYATE